MKRLWFQLGAVGLPFLLLGTATVAAAQALTSGARAIALTATLGEGISVKLSAGTVNFSLTPASPTNPGSTGVVVTTVWNSKPGRDLNLYAFFASPTAALTDGAGANIPSSALQISDNGGAYFPLTNTVIFGGTGAGIQLGAATRIMGLNKQGSRQDSLLFNINLSALQVPAAAYTGVLTIRAQAN